MSKIHVFGVRHYGCNVTRQMVQALEVLKPDVVMIQAPADGNKTLAGETKTLKQLAKMRPPVALQIYDPNDLNRFAIYPYTAYSPYWQAIQFSVRTQTLFHFIDLPHTYQFGMKPDDLAIEKRDPFDAFAEAAGYENGQIWWEQTFERRKDKQDLFAAIMKAMLPLRELDETKMVRLTRLREAHMRQQLRFAKQGNYPKIAVVCDAWHAPMMRQEAVSTMKSDESLLAELPKTHTMATWIPWSSQRLTEPSGYGAGIPAPGWYDYLWQHPNDVTHWLTLVAQLLRKHAHDASPARVIDALSLVQALGALRNLRYVGIDELNEATLTTLADGDEKVMALVHEEMVIGRKTGALPPDMPRIPLHADFLHQLSHLKLTEVEDNSTFRLDLRTPLDLERSHFLHRLQLLQIPLCKSKLDKKQFRQAGIQQKGTFNEAWQWISITSPDIVPMLIGRSMWGNTVQVAADAFVRDHADKATDIEQLTTLLLVTLPADLPDTVQHIINCTKNVVATTTDTLKLMTVLLPLADTLVYRDVRKTDVGMLKTIVDELVTRICLGLTAACMSLDDDGGKAMLERLTPCHHAIRILEDAQKKMWFDVLQKVVVQNGVHASIQGWAARILFDTKHVSINTIMIWMRLGVSTAQEPKDAAAWLTGFLKNSGTILLHNPVLFQLVNDWLMTLDPDPFEQMLPLLRRTFSTFPKLERKRIGQLVTHHDPEAEKTRREAMPDEIVTQEMLPILADLLGIMIDDERDESGSDDDKEDTQ